MQATSGSAPCHEYNVACRLEAALGIVSRREKGALLCFLLGGCEFEFLKKKKKPYCLLLVQSLVALHEREVPLISVIVYAAV